MQAGVRANADKGAQHGPAQTDGIGTAELGVPPRSRGFVMFRQAVFRIEQKVRIHEDHW
jgi:hypothetical protein